MTPTTATHIAAHQAPQQFAAQYLPLEQVTKPNLTTAELAFYSNMAAQTWGTDEHGDVVTSCVVMPDHAARDVRAVKLPQGGNQKIVLIALRAMFKSDGQQGKPGAPPLAYCLELEAAITFAASALLVTPDRKTERARDAITGLVARGVMGCNEGSIWEV